MINTQSELKLTPLHILERHKQISTVVIICIQAIWIPLEEKFLRYLKDYDKYNLNACIYLYFMLIFRFILLCSCTWMFRKYIIFSYCPLLWHFWMFDCLFKAHLLKSLVCSYWPAPTVLSKHRHHPFCFCIVWLCLLLNVMDGWCSIKLSLHKILLEIWQKVRTDYRIVQCFFVSLRQHLKPEHCCKISKPSHKQMFKDRKFICNSPGLTSLSECMISAIVVTHLFLHSHWLTQKMKQQTLHTSRAFKERRALALSPQPRLYHPHRLSNSQPNQETLTASAVPDSSRSLTVRGNPEDSWGLCTSEGYSVILVRPIGKAGSQASAPASHTRTHVNKDE